MWDIREYPSVYDEDVGFHDDQSTERLGHDSIEPSTSAEAILYGNAGAHDLGCLNG
jgi:hypothetical protein